MFVIVVCVINVIIVVVMVFFLYSYFSGGSYVSWDSCRDFCSCGFLCVVVV